MRSSFEKPRSTSQWNQVSLRYFVAIAFALLGVGLIGCSRHPAAPKLPKISAEASGEEAINRFDADDDGKLSLEEATESPELLANWYLVDKNEDQFITAEEIASRISGWQNSPSFVVDATPIFYLDMQPLKDAQVTLELADFLGDNYPSFQAVTNSEGMANLRLDDPRYPGIYPGIYKITVSKQQDGKEIVPAKYNVNTELSCEFSHDRWLSSKRRFWLFTENK